MTPRLPTQAELDLLAKHVANHADLKLVRTGFNRMTLPAIELVFQNGEGLEKFALMFLKETIMDIIIRKMIGDAGGDLKTTLYSSEAFPPRRPVDAEVKHFYNNKPEKKRIYEKGVSIASIPALDNHLKEDQNIHFAFVLHVYLW